MRAKMTENAISKRKVAMPIGVTLSMMGVSSQLIP